MGHTLVDASSGSGSVLIVNPNAEVVVLPGYTLIRKLVLVAAISVAMEETILPIDGPAALSEYLEEIVGGSHPSLSTSTIMFGCTCQVARGFHTFAPCLEHVCAGGGGG